MKPASPERHQTLSHCPQQAAARSALVSLHQGPHSVHDRPGQVPCPIMLGCVKLQRPVPVPNRWIQGPGTKQPPCLIHCRALLPSALGVGVLLCWTAACWHTDSAFCAARTGLPAPPAVCLYVPIPTSSNCLSGTHTPFGSHSPISRGLAQQVSTACITFLSFPLCLSGSLCPAALCQAAPDM